MNAILLYMPGAPEMILILLVVVLLFGGKKIPELMRGLGKGLNEFKKASSEVEDVSKEIEQTNSASGKSSGKKEKIIEDEDAEDIQVKK